MAELVYPPVIATARTLLRALDLRFQVEGAEHVPRRGGAVLASTHLSYLDFLFCGYAVRPAGRRVRFMAKKQVFDHPVAGPLMRGMRHIPVDREAGAGSYRSAVQALRGGEIVGVFPEATISRSFTVKAVKTGAARMAAEASVPLLPMAVWGGQRLFTKGRPRQLRRRTPIWITIGAPLHPSPESDPATVTEELAARLAELLDTTQRCYPDEPTGPDDTWWLPVRLGGTAPTPEEAARLDAAERAARRTQRQQRR